MKTYKVEVDRYGNEYWLNENGELHRENDKPAIIWSNGTKEWRVNGQRLRDNDKPAVIYPDGTKEWWFNGKRYYPEQKNECDGKIVEIDGKRYKLQLVVE